MDGPRDAAAQYRLERLRREEARARGEDPDATKPGDQDDTAATARTPTSAERAAYVETVIQQAIRRGSFSSVKELVTKIDHFVAHYNAHSRPFAWTATAESILAKVHRLCACISGTQH